MLEGLLTFGLPIGAFVLSIVSIVIAWWNWRQSNRPIVVATIRTHSGGNVAILYDLVVLNAGTRPAVNVRLDTTESQLAACLAQPELVSTEKPLWREAVRCFSEEGTIPLLVHGTEAKNSFGYTGDAGGKGSFWKYRGRFSIRILYDDLDGNSYTSRQVLIIQDSSGFADGSWSASR